MHRKLMIALRRKGGLPPGMRLGQAVDISYALLGPELFHALVTELSILRRELLA